MRIELDLSTVPPTLELADADDCTALSLRIRPTSHAHVPVGLLRALAEDHPVGADWEDRFAAMLTYADSRGWIRGEDGAVRVHIE